MIGFIEIRKLLDLGHLNLTRRIFDQTWNRGAGTEITLNLLKAMVHSGSYLSGAFIDDKIVGAAFAFPATNN